MNHYEAKVEARRERLEARAERLASEGRARIARADKMAEAIPFGQPILVGHHSERGDRAYRAKIQNGFRSGYETLKAAGEAQARAESVGTGGISSDDPDAVSKLREKLAVYEEAQILMKARNKVLKGSHEAWQLSNNSANIRRIKERIAALEKASERVHKEITRESYRVVQNVEANRVQIIFDGKPDEAIRAKLKSHGFRWAPSEGAWQRHLNNAGVYAAQCILREIP